MIETKTITLLDKLKSTNALLAALRSPQHGLESINVLLSVDEINGLCEWINLGRLPMTETKTITLLDKLKSTNALLAALRSPQHGLESINVLLSVDEINELCEWINFGDEPRPSTDEDEVHSPN